MEKHVESLPFEVDKIRAWEKGEGSPSISQLRKLGKAYKRPIAVFFLPEPPADFAAQKEFRRLPGLKPGDESPALIFAIRQAVYHRAIAIELSDLTGNESQPMDEVLHPGLDPEVAGRIARASLGISWEEQLAWDSPHSALSAWRNSIESRSVLIFQAGGIDLNEMRGTCIPDQPYPLILINSKDAPHGRIFTLMHEYIHILLHAAGHQTARLDGRRAPEEQSLEVAANSFAAAALLPRDGFLAELARYPGAIGGEDTALRLLSQRVKVSPEAVLRRLVDLGVASRSVYRSKRKEWGQQLWYVKTSKGGPIPQAVKVLAREGKNYAGLVLEAYDRDLITTNAASDYLGTKPVHFPNIRRNLLMNA